MFLEILIGIFVASLIFVIVYKNRGHSDNVSSDDILSESPRENNLKDSHEICTNTLSTYCSSIWSGSKNATCKFTKSHVKGQGKDKYAFLPLQVTPKGDKLLGPDGALGGCVCGGNGYFDPTTSACICTQAGFDPSRSCMKCLPGYTNKPDGEIGGSTGLHLKHVDGTPTGVVLDQDKTCTLQQKIILDDDFISFYNAGGINSYLTGCGTDENGNKSPFGLCQSDINAVDVACDGWDNDGGRTSNRKNYMNMCNPGADPKEDCPTVNELGMVYMEQKDGSQQQDMVGNSCKVTGCNQPGSNVRGECHNVLKWITEEPSVTSIIIPNSVKPKFFTSTGGSWDYNMCGGNEIGPNNYTSTPGKKTLNGTATTIYEFSGEIPAAFDFEPNDGYSCPAPTTTNCKGCIAMDKFWCHSNKTCYDHGDKDGDVVCKALNSCVSTMGENSCSCSSCDDTSCS